MKNLVQSVLILIAGFMSTTGAEELIYAQVGDRVTLEPPGGKLPQKCYLLWTFGRDEQNKIAGRNLFGVPWIDDKMKPIFSWAADSLVINNIQQEYFGTFVYKITESDTCQATRITYRILKLSLTPAPPLPLLPGERLLLACDAETPPGKKKPTIHWLNPQEVKMSRTGQLSLHATGQHNGQWTCVVTTDKKENKAKISVTVADLSPAPARPQYTSKSLPLTVPCSILAHISWEQLKAMGIQEGYWNFLPEPGSSLIPGDPQRLFSLSLGDELHWTPHQDRELIPVKDLQKGNLTLTRNRAREDDSGDYECGLKFENGLILNRTVHVKVLQLISSPGTELISGQQVKLTCGLGHPLPSGLQLKWIPPKSKSFLPSSDHHSTNVITLDVGTEDGGKWRCELWQNNTQLTSAVISLKIEPRLSVSMLVIIVTLVIVFLLLTLVFILYRRRQRMRHPRHRLCQCKNPKPKGFYKT